MAGDCEIHIDDLNDGDTVCSICCAEFLDTEDLQMHISQVHHNEKAKHCSCQFCSSTFNDLEEYAFHVRDEHILSLKCCKYCTRIFTVAETLKRHESMHYSDATKPMFLCSQCETRFNNIYDLEQHEFKEHENDDNGVMLRHLFPILSSILNIKASTFLQSLGSTELYMCPQCEKSSITANDHIKHLQAKKCISMACEKCFNVYRDKNGLRRHFSMHKECSLYVTDQDRVKYCSKCKKNINLLAYNKHSQSCRPAKCSICNIVFDSLPSLTEHQTKEHPMAIMMKICRLCQKHFVGSVALQKHMVRVHKGKLHLYKYCCIYCENSVFQHPQKLFAHFFSKHHDIQPFSCKICNLTFKIRKRFTIHIKLEHKGIGFIEFDNNYHVFFTDKKSEEPFRPKSLFGAETPPREQEESEVEETVQTDVDNESTDKRETGKKPPKIRFKEQGKFTKNINLVNVNSDFMSATETEAIQTENESKAKSEKPKMKRKSKTLESKTKKQMKIESQAQSDNTDNLSDASDDMPLLVVRKRENVKRRNRLRTAYGNTRSRDTGKKNKKSFTCNICKKFCYTYQNYYHHISLHFKNEIKRCIKCAEEFKTKSELTEHMQTQHSQSKLTDILKDMIERRKLGLSTRPEESTSEKFQKTIKKVKTVKVNSAATIKEVPNRLSVKNFLENFTPDVENVKKNVDISCNVTVQKVQHPVVRKPAIKMVKYIPKEEKYDGKLALPLRFKAPPVQEAVKLQIKLVQQPLSSYKPVEENTKYNDEIDTVDYEIEVDNDKYVPDIAEEVLLKESEEPKISVVPHKILIPKLPTQGYQKVEIGHMFPEAPYYKIVPVKDILTPQPIDKQTAVEPEKNIKLPDGTKLVNVNPLAHLLGDTPIENIVGPASKKYYQPKRRNYKSAIATALMKLEGPRRKRTKKSVEVEQ